MELNRSVASARVAFLRVAAIVSSTTGVPVAEILERQRCGRPNRRRDSPVSFARLAATYLTVTACNIRQASLARMLGRHRRRILFDVRFIEDARERFDIDQLFERMEAML
ncbi:hypothetical protein [Mesorhizobium sp. M1399]|uniref:hypothetical protein n=1 Tax=Mesorhizobium sp. M1399 TaxID=2957096 RepID=UPI00333D0792